MKSKLIALFATLATIVATIVASSACLFYSFQPEEPKCLREE